MNVIMMSLGWVGIMLVLGMICRAKIGFFRSMLVPSSIIGGVIGFALMNLTGGLPMTAFPTYGTMVGQLFILSFISIGLTATDATGGTASQTNKNIFQGSIGMGFLWNILYALTPVVGYFCVLATRAFGDGMDPKYGLLIPFAFAQGPGQSVTYGTILESYGMENAAMVAVTFAVVGFLFAFVVGVPMAKAGLRRGLGVHSKQISPSMAKGVFPREEQTVPTGINTCHSGNIDTLAFHMALVGISYIMTYFFTLALLALFGEGAASILWGMFFMNGMVMSYLVKWIMKKLKADYIHDNATQKRITNFATDFLVVSSFMSVQLTLISRWIVPILTTCAVVWVITYFLCIYFGKRFGGPNDFERTLGIYGTATGTVPTGIALVRIVDPELSTTTAVELGAMNLPMMIPLITIFTILGVGEGTLTTQTGLLLMLAPIPIYLIVMRIFKAWGKKTYTFKEGYTPREEE